MKTLPSAFPIILGHDQIIETAFYKWLEKQDEAEVDLRHFINVIKAYTGMDKPFVGRVDGKAHKTVYSVFWGHKQKARASN